MSDDSPTGARATSGGSGAAGGLPPLPPPGGPVVALVDAEDRVAWADAGFADLTGVRSGAALGDLLATLAPGGADRLGPALATARDGGTGALRLGGRRPDGRPFAVDLVAEPAGPPSTVALVGARLGGPCGWGVPPPADADTLPGVDVVLSHDVRGALRHAAGFGGVVLKALRTASEGGPLPEALAPAPDRLDTAVGAVATGDAMVEACVRQLRVLDEAWGIEPIDVERLVARAVATARSRREGALPPVELVAAADLGVAAAADRLTEALVELLVNAAVFGGDDVQISVSATAVAPGWVEVRVADDGPGVDPDLAEDAFLPGRMLQPRGRFPGVGMGLPFARLVVSRHGGSLHLEPVGAGAGTAAAAVVPSAEGAPPPPSAVAGDDR